MLGIFDEVPQFFDKARQPSMQSYTCHQGSPRPERDPRG
jgi:hypothetical protein